MAFWTKWNYFVGENWNNKVRQEFQVCFLQSSLITIWKMHWQFSFASKDKRTNRRRQQCAAKFPQAWQKKQQQLVSKHTFISKLYSESWCALPSFFVCFLLNIFTRPDIYFKNVEEVKKCVTKWVTLESFDNLYLKCREDF